MQSSASHQIGLEPETADFYCRSIRALLDAGVRFLVGGAYAFARYTGIERHTKDFDIFVRPTDRERVLEVLTGSGCDVQVTYPHWLAKAYCGDDFVDVIYSSGNGVAEVDDGWFAHATDDEVLGLPVQLCPAEEIIWSKSYVMERERYDGADVNHLLRACGTDLDWRRLIDRFGRHWRILLSQLVLFQFCYPGEHTAVPRWVMQELLGRVHAEIDTPPPARRVCYGTLISREQYLIDIERWGYTDARLLSDSSMTPEDAANWSAAAFEGEPEPPGRHGGAEVG